MTDESAVVVKDVADELVSYPRALRTAVLAAIERIAADPAAASHSAVEHPGEVVATPVPGHGYAVLWRLEAVRPGNSRVVVVGLAPVTQELRPLDDEIKATAITAANVFVWSLVMACLTFGFRSYTPPHLVGLFSFEAAVILIGFGLSSLGTLVRRAFFEALGGFDGDEAAHADRWDARFESPALARVRHAGLYVITIGSFISLGVLVQETGGFVSSPFSPLIVGLLVLAPYLMTGSRTPLVNHTLGLAFVIGLILLKDRAEPAPAQVSTWVYLVVIGSVVAVSSSFFVIVARYRQFADARDDVQRTTRRLP
ncbi:MAG: hypothetical protein QOD92_3128 [Acidimicrobiaceae bacterium]|jgi:hypothetical protein